jgi:hypothetical protein
MQQLMRQRPDDLPVLVGPEMVLPYDNLMSKPKTIAATPVVSADTSSQVLNHDGRRGCLEFELQNEPFRPCVQILKGGPVLPIADAHLMPSQLDIDRFHNFRHTSFSIHNNIIMWRTTCILGSITSP